MPLVRLEVRKGRSAAHKRALLDAAHAALVAALRIPDHDRMQRIVEHVREDFELPPGSSDDFVLAEVTMFGGRSQEAKRRLYQALVRNFGELGVAPADVLIVLHEPPMENWGIRGGQIASEVDLGFRGPSLTQLTTLDASSSARPGTVSGAHDPAG
jgi:phenylpyruvate tautomerase PptA (4-oxalocrotonate tautomerase family)